MQSKRLMLARLVAIFVIPMISSGAIAADKYGIFELLNHSSLSYEDTVTAVSAALKDSAFVVHGEHEVRVPDGKQQAHIFVLTSPDYVALAESESPRTVSAQVLRIAVFTWGDDQKTMVNMANPVAHAMVYYAGSENYATLVAGAKKTAADIRAALAAIPGEAVSVQQNPLRTEKHYRKFNGDGPARMMAKFRTFRKSQLLIHEANGSEFENIAATVAEVIVRPDTSDVSKSTDWEPVVQIQFGDNVTFYGITNSYVEDKMIRINSRFRSDGKSDAAPFPGTDHVAALPTEVLVIREEGETKVLHYGQMWRMQLYFWDSGYRAFTANVGVPGAIAKSIEKLLEDEFE